MEMQRMLEERGKTHGSFEVNAFISQKLKTQVRTNNPSFTDMQAEALDMICSKISRICSGNSDEPDHWRDIAGYALLVVESLEKTTGV